MQSDECGAKFDPKFGCIVERCVNGKWVEELLPEQLRFYFLGRQSQTITKLTAVSYGLMIESLLKSSTVTTQLRDSLQLP